MQEEKLTGQTGGSQLAGKKKSPLARRRRQAAALSLALGTGLALAICAAFYLYGEFSAEMTNPTALFLGLFVGGFNLAIFILVQARRLLGRSWQGFVIDKTVQARGKNTLYTILVQGPAGKKKRIHFPNDPESYACYRLGDQVLYQPGWSYLEKIEGSTDLCTFCSNCARKCAWENELCPKCGWPL